MINILFNDVKNHDISIQPSTESPLDGWGGPRLQARDQGGGLF